MEAGPAEACSMEKMVLPVERLGSTADYPRSDQQAPRSRFGDQIRASELPLASFRVDESLVEVLLRDHLPSPWLRGAGERRVESHVINRLADNAGFLILIILLVLHVHATALLCHLQADHSAQDGEERSTPPC
jgi:hypothetical protein